MKTIAVVAAVLVTLVAALATLVRVLARRVVGVKARRKTILVRRIGDHVEMPSSTQTLSKGSYGLWFGERFENHALVGPVVASDDRQVIRQVLKSTAPISTEPFKAQWTGHIMSGPADIDPDWEDVSVPLSGGGSAPAWLFRGDSTDAPWVIHVQGIRTSRLVTLRSVEVAQSAGLTSLVITYRGSGDGPPASTSTLGQCEWSDLGDAIAFARSCGAPAVYVVAWSMGAGIALELLRRDSHAFDRLVLIAPATNWRRIIEHGVKRAGLPRLVAHAVQWGLASPMGWRVIGLPEPLDLNRLDWSEADIIRVPVLVVHSKGDEEIPFELTQVFADANPTVSLVELLAAPHGWEANREPERFRAALSSWLVSSGSSPRALQVDDAGRADGDSPGAVLGEA